MVLALPEPREAAPGVEHHGRAAGRLQAREDVLHPAPVGLAAGEARALGEAVEFVGVVILFLEFALVPHRVGHHAVEGLEAVPFAELGLAEGIADLNLALHVMDNHIHVRHRPCAGFVFLTVEFGRRERLARAEIHLFLQDQLALDEQSGRAAAGIVDIHPRLGVHDPRDDETNLCRCVKLSRALAAALSEFPNQILVAAPDDVRLHVGEAERLGANRLDEIA